MKSQPSKTCPNQVNLKDQSNLGQYLVFRSKTLKPQWQQNIGQPRLGRRASQNLSILFDQLLSSNPVGQVDVHPEVVLVVDHLLAQDTLNILGTEMGSSEMNISVAPRLEQSVASHATTSPVFKRFQPATHVRCKQRQQTDQPTKHGRFYFNGPNRIGCPRRTIILEINLIQT